MRVLLIGDPEDAGLIRHGEFLAEAGGEVHLAVVQVTRPATKLDGRWKVHRAPASSVAISTLSTSARTVIPRLRVAVARTSYRVVEATRAALGTEMDPGPFALWPSAPWLSSDDDRLVHRLRAYATRPTVDVPWLAKVIGLACPDIVTTFGLVPHGLLMLAVRRSSPGVTVPWVLALGETDLERVEHDGALATILETTLSDVDGLLVERERELAFARLHGFRGDRAVVGPSGGGWRLSECRSFRQPGPTSQRRTVAVSGARGVSGRPFVALRALELVADALRGYEVSVYSPGEGVELGAKLLANATEVKIEVVSAGRLRDALTVHGRARCSLVQHAADRTDPSLLDALVMGSFPIGSVTCRADGRVRDGVTGLLVDPEDPPALAAAIRRALGDDGLVDGAASENAVTAETQLSREVVGEPILKLYRRLMGSAGD